MNRAVVGRLRRLGIWSAAQKAHRLIAPPSCAAAHAVVERLGPSLISDDLVLKHRYDYELVSIDPRRIIGVLSAGAVPATDGDGLRDRYRAWRDLGGGWKSANRHFSRNLHGRFIVDGDWDVRAVPFRILESVTKIFVEGRDPSETEEYQRFLARVESGNLAWTKGMRTVDHIDAYFEELIAVYRAIETSGYRTQEELGNDGSDEIRVCIDRNGRPLVFGGGTHRLSIVLLLDIDEVPVVVKRVHADWVARCIDEYGGTVHTAIAAGIDELRTAPEGV